MHFYSLSIVRMKSCSCYCPFSSSTDLFPSLILFPGHNQYTRLGWPSSIIHPSISDLGLESALPRSETCHNPVLLFERIPGCCPTRASFSWIEGLRPPPVLGEFSYHAAMTYLRWLWTTEAPCRGGAVSVRHWHLVLVHVVCLVTLDEGVQARETLGFTRRRGVAIRVPENREYMTENLQIFFRNAWIKARACQAIAIVPCTIYTNTPAVSRFNLDLKKFLKGLPKYYWFLNFVYMNLIWSDHAAI
jgi:hypothetical protein